MAQVMIGCKLPTGLILSLAKPGGDDTPVKVKIAGLNDSPLKNAPYTTTLVDEEFWNLWSALHAQYAPLKNGSIFVARTADELTGKARDLEKKKTGLEPIRPDSMGVEKAKE